MNDKRIPLGRIHGLFGVRGWLKVYSYTRPMENLLDYERWFLNSAAEGRPAQWRPFRVVDARPHGKTLVARLQDDREQVVADRDVAAQLLGCDIAVARSDMPALADGAWYWHDLVGLEVRNREQVALGHVEALMETGAHDVLVVQGDKQRLIPFVTEVYIDEIDLDGGCMRVDWNPED